MLPNMSKQSAAVTLEQMTFVDCHCHLASQEFNDDLETVVARAIKAGVGAMFVCSTSQASIYDVVRLAHTHPQHIFPCLGLHPLSEPVDDAPWEIIRNSIVTQHAEIGIAAIGEIGLDFSPRILKERASASGKSQAQVKAAQIVLFEEQIALALELGIPVNVHSRRAEKETLDIVIRSKAQAVMHAFLGDPSLAVEAAKTGRVFFSFPPSTVYKYEYQEVVKALPVDVLLLETDSPKLGARGSKERNEPGFIGIAAAKLAELKNISVEEVAHRTSLNALKLFGASAPALVEMLNGAVLIPGADLKRARWRKDIKGGMAGRAEVDNKGEGESNTLPPANSASRWQRRCRQMANVLDPSLCSTAFGSTSCD